VSGALAEAVAADSVGATTVEDAPPVEGRSARWTSFGAWGLAAYLGSVAALVAAVLVYLHGTFVYVLDDPAIHLSVAENLVRDGTWGVEGGAFQSASSSPLWTLLLAGAAAVTPGNDHWLPLLLNVVAGVGVVLLIGRNQVAIAGRRWSDRAAVAFVVVVLLFLPGLALVGMEHTLHILLVLGAVLAVQQRADQPLGRAWVVPWGLLALASLARFETAFVAAGLALGLVVQAAAARRNLRAAVVKGAAISVAALVPVALFGLVNHALGGGYLPNSILAKGQGLGASSRAGNGSGPIDMAQRLTADPVVAGLVVVAVAYLILTWGRPAPQRLLAVTVVGATVLHAAFADMGWYERYQAYLIAVGVLMLLGVLAELPAGVQRRCLAALVVGSCLLAPNKINALVKVPMAADDMYRGQYQVARFLERYYEGQVIGTDQLGYISLFHDGPITDYAGLGDYEALQRYPDDSEDAEQMQRYLADLARERGIEVVALPSWGIDADKPPGWISVGFFESSGNEVTRVSDVFVLWATTPEAVRPLQEHLREFGRDLPPRMTLTLNEWATWKADAELQATGKGSAGS